MGTRGAVQGRPRGHPARLRVRLPAVQGGSTQRPVLGHGPHRRRGRLRARPRHHSEPRFGDGQRHRARPAGQDQAQEKAPRLQPRRRPDQGRRRGLLRGEAEAGGGPEGRRAGGRVKYGADADKQYE